MANATAATAAPSTTITTGKVRFSYLNIFEPKAAEGSDEKKYSASLIIPKSDTKTIEKIQAAIKQAQENGKATKFGGKLPAGLKNPLRDGDTDRPDDPAYEDAYFINANNKNQPGIVDKGLNKVLDSTEVYSGCYGRASITFFAYNTAGNKGIGVALNHIQKLEDGEPLGSTVRVEDAFGDDAEDLL